MPMVSYSLLFTVDNINRYWFEKSTDDIFTLEYHRHLGIKYSKTLLYKVRVLFRKKVAAFKELRALSKCFKYEEEAMKSIILCKE